MKKMHYGWVICFCCMLLMLCNSGFSANVLPCFLPYLQECGLSATQSSSLITIRCLFGILGMLLVDLLYKKISLKVGLVASCLIAGFSFFLMSISTNYFCCCISVSLLGFVYGFGAIIPISLLLNRWFTKKRGKAIAIASIGTGFCSMLAPVIITDLTHRFSLKACFCFQTSVAILIAAFTGVLLKSDPAEKGLSPYGNVQCVVSASNESSAEAPRNIIILLKISMLSLGAGCMVSYSHLSPLYLSGIHTKMEASICISLTGFAVIIGKYLFGIVSDYRSCQFASSIFLSIAIIGCVACCFSLNSYFLMYASALLLGIGYPPSSVGIPLYAADFSTSKTYPSLLRDCQLYYTGGGFLIGFLPGFLFDQFGTYVISFFIFAALIFLCLVLTTFCYSHTRKKKVAQ